MQNTMPHLGKRVFAGAMAGALALSVCAIPTQSAWAVDAKDVSTYVSGSATPMRVADPQILGISTVDERWSIEDGVTYDELTNTSGGLRYLLMGTDEYNENPDPYIYNTVYETDGVKIIQNSTRSGYSASQAMRALSPYGQFDSDDAIWNMLPDVIIGTMMDNNETTDYSTEARGVEQALGLEANSYNPIGVANNQQDTIGVLYRTAEAGNQAAENTGKELRYGDAVELVKNYEKYVKGSQGYVLKRLAQDGAEKKSVVVITANDGNGTVTLATGAGDQGWDYMGAVTEVANNFADTLSTDESVSISVQELESYADQIDLIMLASDDNYGEGFVPTTGLENLFGKMYWTLDQDCGGICADNRGVDYARNFGLLLGALYPEYIDQSDWIAYYYDTVYHVKDNMISTAIDRAMDGVRNWDVTSGDASAYVQWSAATAADYNRDEVAGLMEEGIDYIRGIGASASENLQLSDYIADEAPSATFPDVPAGEWFAEAVQFVAENGIMKGYDAGADAGQFGVGDQLTRAQTAQIMYNYAAGNGENVSAAADRNTTGLADLDAVAWYTQACNWAYANGVMTGDAGAGTFRPNDPISLQELVQVLANALATEDEVNAADPAGLDAYPDGGEVYDWFVPAMAWGLEEGLYGNDSQINPTGSIPRERVAQVIFNAFDNGLM